MLSCTCSCTVVVTNNNIKVNLVQPRGLASTSTSRTIVRLGLVLAYESMIHSRRRGVVPRTIRARSRSSTKREIENMRSL